MQAIYLKIWIVKMAIHIFCEPIYLWPVLGADPLMDGIGLFDSTVATFVIEKENRLAKIELGLTQKKKKRTGD